MGIFEDLVGNNSTKKGQALGFFDFLDAIEEEKVQNNLWKKEDKKTKEENQKPYEENLKKEETDNFQ